MMLLSKIDRALSGAGKGDRNKPAAEAAPVQDRSVEAVAGMIGERYETIQGGIDQMTELVQRFQAFEPLLTQIREPLAAEYQARREEYLELINLRGSGKEQGERIEGLTGENRRLTTLLASTESQRDEVQAHGAEQATAAQEARLEIDRLRNALSQAEAQVEALRTSDQAGSQRIKQLEQDQATLRDALKEMETHRAEADAGRTRAVRDQSLAADENTALKKRMEEVGAEIARLARAEASLEGQLTAERARASAEQAESARALRVLEGQSEATRSEASALQAKLDTLGARAQRLDTINIDLSTRLAELQASSQLNDRRGADMQTSLYRALERVRELEAGAEDGRQRAAAMDAARLAAVDRADHLAKSNGTQEKALARSEERVARLQDRVGALQAEHEQQVETLNDQIAGLKATSEGFRAESAIIVAALETARRERANREPSSRTTPPRNGVGAEAASFAGTA